MATAVWNPNTYVPSLGTIGDLVPGVVEKFGNRQDLNTTADNSSTIKAITGAVLNLTETYEFEELKFRSPVGNLVFGESEYAISTLIAGNPIDAIDLTKMFTITFWFEGQVNAVRNLKYRRYPTVVMYAFGLGGQSNIDTPPIYWSRYNNNISLGPAPDQDYSYFIMLQLRHPTMAEDQANQPIYMPPTWQEVVEYDAARRLALNEGAFDYATNFYKALNGDPKTGEPGLLKGLIPQMERDETMNERQLSLAMSRYTFGRV